MKTCSRCKNEKTFEDYTRNGDGYYSMCKACRKTARQAQRGTTFAHSLKYYHSITVEQFNKMLADQNGLCRLCETDTPGGSGTWHVDHDHACCPGTRGCGKCIRGLLCAGCNISVGHLEKHLIREKIPGVLSVFQYIESRADIHGTDI